MKQRIVWILLAAFLASCGRATPPQPLPVPDSTTQAFRAIDVTIDTGAVMLAGTLLTPLDNSPAPAVILIPGLGAATRNGSWNMYRRIGEYLAERGIAVLLYDKRGVGGSTGDWESESFDERAHDVAAFLLGSGLTILVTGQLSTAFGFLSGSALQNPERLGLDFAFTAVFTALAIGMWKGSSSLLPWVIAALTASIAAHLLPGRWYILLGGLAGSFAGAWSNED